MSPERFGSTQIPVVPSRSVCSPTAASRRPLAARNDILTVIPGPLDDAALRQRIEASEAFAIMKLGRHFPKVRAVIDDLGLTDRAVYVERATLEAEVVRRARG